MAIPDFQTLMLPVLRACASEMQRQSLIAAMSQLFNLTVDEQTRLLPLGGQTVLTNRISWAKVHLGKAGLLQRTGRGQVAATPLGLEVLARSPDRIDVAFLREFESYRTFLAASRKAADASVIEPTTAETKAEAAPEERIRSARAEIESALAGELLDAVLSREPAFFERLIVRLLTKMGYGGSLEDAGRALGKSGDGGVDGVIDEDALGLDRVYVQAKRYKPDNLVGPGAVRDFFGALDAFRANKGLFVTTSGFSPQAVQTAANLSKRIVLVDGARLTELMIRHDVGVRVIDTVPIKKIDEDYFDAE